MIPALAAAVLVLVGLLAFSLFSDDDQVGDEEGAMVEVYDDGDGDDVYTFSTDILRSVASKIESKISSIQALDLFLDNISGFVEENQITEEEQVELSEHFAEKAKEKKKDEVLSIFAMRSLKMLKVAISFNPRNRNAWNQMIELYKLNGLKLRAKKAQKEMDAVFADD